MDYIPFKRSCEIITQIPRAPNSEFENTENGILNADAVVRVYELGNRAVAGEKDAAQALLNIARESVVELAALCREHPELFSEIAPKLPQWPVLASKHKENHRANLQFFERIKLGAKADIKAAAGSKWNRENPATVIALDLIAAVRANIANHALVEATKGKTSPWVALAIKLPPLSKTTAKVWWRVAKMAFLESYPHPEKLPELKNLVGNRAYSESERRARILDLIGRTLGRVTK